ncbi:type I addiction module toxin, SymE family [Salmonella enterica subsp. enterica serovar Woodinville]|nr:type I addiction module toxin, SymE family [Salmonella enterica]EBS3975519.1 hypothetical protein [Salmonella enterica subsp. enterica serovar Woodinville]EBL6516905.1 type I addiction module toxin, SymE family [Salmonella enterica]ECG8037908.1 type I addiction module toxin, SymE family [Salmonella enterica subsp. enterica serovar Woodinville]ECL7666521.1 type I addiction module toxin, SymE family [Salmonella enterica]
MGQKKDCTRSASLRLNGRWMEEGGFITGTPLDIRLMPSSLVITAKPRQQILAFLQDCDR